MFDRAKVFNQPINNWDVCVKHEDMFITDGQHYKFNQPLNNWNVSSVTDMQNMFGTTNGDGDGDNRAFNQDIGDWDVSNVTNMAIGMFKSANQFNQDLSDWDISKVTSISVMFDRADDYNNGGISLNCWDTSNITSMGFTFFRTVLIKIFLNGVFSLLVQLQAVFLVVHHLMVMQHSNQSGVNHVKIVL